MLLGHGKLITELKENCVQTARLGLLPSDDGVKGVVQIMGHMPRVLLPTLFPHNFSVREPIMSDNDACQMP